MKVLKKAVPKFSYVSSAAQFIERSEFFLPKKYISEIVKDSLPSFENTEEVVNFLKRTGVHLSKPDREMLMEKALNFINSEEQLKAFQSVLPDSEYQAALKQFQNSSKGVGGRMSERLKCLRRQLQLAMPKKTKIQIFLLLEHKSTYDIKLFQQLFRYQTLLIEKSLNEQGKARPYCSHCILPWKKALEMEIVFSGCFGR